MHQRNPIINVPLLIGIGLSVALHGAALYSKGLYTPPAPMLEQGRTVVHLTLLPSVASKGNPNPELLNPKPVPQTSSLPDPAPPEALPTETESINSPEQDASPIEEKGVVSEAQATRTIHPTYPRISRRHGEEGTVTLSIEIMANGKTGRVLVLQSSGHRRLDEAAIKAARETPFTPATQFGRNVNSETELSFKFRLTDD